MKKNKISIIVLVILFFATSCQDVIDIELDSIDPKLVVEGTINDLDDNCTIKLSKTGDYFSPDGYPAVSDAIISITGNNIGTINFTENSDGIYTANYFQGNENSLYTLKINSENENYETNVTIPQKVNIDSVSFMPVPPSPHFDGGFLVIVHFVDPEEFVNFYRIKVYKIGDENKGNGSFHLADDKLSNGNSTQMPYNAEVFEPLDTVIIELQNLDKSTYDFYSTLSEIAGSSGGPPIATSTPANPENNIENALGNFCAYSVCKDTLTFL